MKRLGILICIMGSVAALLYPPYKILGLGKVKWGFILDDVVRAFGSSVAKTYDYIDKPTLAVELLVINAIGVSMILMAKRR